MSETMDEGEAIQTFTLLTNSTTDEALDFLQRFHWDLNVAVNHFIESDNETGSRRLLESRERLETLLPPATDVQNVSPLVVEPPEVREIPVDWKERDEANHTPIQGLEVPTDSGHAAGMSSEHPQMVEESMEPEAQPWPRDSSRPLRRRRGTSLHREGMRARIQRLREMERRGLAMDLESDDDDLKDDYQTAVEQDMMQTAMEASEQELSQTARERIEQRIQMGITDESVNEDLEIARALALSVKSAEAEKRRRQSEMEGTGGAEAVDEEEPDRSPPVAESEPPVRSDAPPAEEIDVPGLSAEEQEEARMIEAAMFGLPYVSSREREWERRGGGRGYLPGRGLAYEGDEEGFNSEGRGLSPWQRRAPVPPPAEVLEQRLLREQQDDEFLASLAADREREEKEVEREREREREREAQAERERRQSQEEEERRGREEAERLLQEKKGRLVEEPAVGSDDVITVLVRMPDGGKVSRRFQKGHSLQCLFDFLDVERGANKGRYRLVQMYPRRRFSGGNDEAQQSFQELGLNSKQEALVLEPL